MKNLIIMSAELTKYNAAQNKRRTEVQRSLLEKAGIKAIESKGVYKGTSESSTVIPVGPDAISNASIAQAVDDAFTVFNQESVLMVFKGEATLVFASGEEVKLGQFRQCTKEEALGRDAYTIINGEYWIAG